MNWRLGVVGICLLLAAISARAQDKGTTLEEVVARVNNDIITRSDLERARRQLRDEIQRDCKACSPAEVDQKYAEQEKDLLRDLIDNSLLVQRGKDLGTNVETQMVKRLDEIRIENNISSMEELERQVTATGQDYEDFKNTIRNQLLQQEVMRREVNSRIILDRTETQKYYDEHKPEFVRPEQVFLREIFVSTEGKSEEEKATLRKKADGLLQRVKGGEDFGELAKRFSDGSTAKQGGDLGSFERNQLAAALADVVFPLKKNDVTDVMPTQTGFLILQVREHYPAGQQPLETVENEIMNRLYGDKLKPALREYLQTLRRNSYMHVKPGYVDTAGVPEATIDEVSPVPEETSQKPARGIFPFGKIKNGA
jgi:peptidyl-prolyl cis-trans isomerase SurA